MAERLRRAICAIIVVGGCVGWLLAGAQFDFKYDVPYVPTPPVVIEEVLRLANVKADDFVIDLGSGDGRVVIAAAKKFGAHGVGVDFDEDLLAQSVQNARTAGLSERVAFHRADLFKFEISRATVVTMYLLPSVNIRLRPRLLKELRPGARIVSHDFTMEDWLPDQKSTLRKNVFLWIVPADVGGRWRTALALPGAERSYEIEVRHKFQEIDGLARYDKRVAGLWNAKLQGDRITFVIVDDAGGDESNLYFDGRVTGDTIDGVVKRGVGNDEKTYQWRATRIAVTR